MPSKRVTAGMYFPDPNNPGQKLFKWFRDDWSRRKIVAIEGAGYQTSAEVSAAIAAAIGGITELEYMVVSALPVSGAKGVIYLVPHSHGTADIYDEYIWINNSYEKIGNTDVDLSQYLLKTDIATWAKQPNKPTYTASEVGALPDTTVIPAASSNAPVMDGSGAAGSSGDYARADHVHPSDTAKQDALTSAQLAAVNSGITDEFVTGKFAVLTETIASGWSAYTTLPTGFTPDNCVCIGITVSASNTQWRCGEGVSDVSDRLFVTIDGSGLRLFCNISWLAGRTYKAALMRTDI